MAICVIIIILLLRGFIERRIAQRPQVRYVSSGIVNCSHVNRQQKCLQLCSESLNRNIG